MTAKDGSIWPDYNGYCLPARVDGYVLGPIVPTPVIEAEKILSSHNFVQWVLNAPEGQRLLGMLEELGRMVEDDE